MIDSDALKALFLEKSHNDRPISYYEFKSAGLSDKEYLTYCNLCEAIRGACIMVDSRLTYGMLKPPDQIVDNTILNLKCWLERAMNTTFPKNLTCRSISSLSHYWTGPWSGSDGELISAVFTESEDFRNLLEFYIRNIWILGKSMHIHWIMPGYQTSKPSKKEKRESCEFFTYSKCLLNGEKCDKAHCSEYLKNGGLPLKRLPTTKDTVDFGDTVCVLSANSQSFTIVIPDYKDQLSMKPIEKVLVHKKVGATIVAGSTEYKICSVKKAPKQPSRTHKPVCLLSEWQKAKLKLRELEDELMTIDVPNPPEDLGDSFALTKWAKEAGNCINRIDDLEGEIEVYEEWLGMGE